MAPLFFDRAAYVRRTSSIEEIACLEEVFDFLDEWPEERRDLAYDTLHAACRKAANGSFPLEAIRRNFELFAKRAGLLVEIESVPRFGPRDRNRTVGN
ncbi:DUF982 domain-containing protein [Rhizobium sp. Root1220]|uniref:DUF982 domain-containing protein n=1 Tax=Rhizobium sp. Root1220 TaxID=1736432 RepID=UPI000701214B|nr:DUF982 domain-containing protein [Rhizobium sp. Root1220]KQV81868.1 hypothetical protein ASC90_24765 [Rhizobium sp. Root1220]